MADVFVVAMMLVVFSLRGGIGDDVPTKSEVGVGLYFFAAYCVLSLATGQFLARRSAVTIPEGLSVDYGMFLLTIAAFVAGFILTSLFQPGTRLEQQFVVKVNEMRACSVVNTSGPGAIAGHWESSGVEHGGADNVVVSATLLDPSGGTLRYWDHHDSGTFDEIVKLPGVYSLVFSNFGIIRSTNRTVRVEIAFVPR